jgi:hypothetical protein
MACRLLQLLRAETKVVGSKRYLGSNRGRTISWAQLVRRAVEVMKEVGPARVMKEVVEKTTLAMFQDGILDIHAYVSNPTVAIAILRAWLTEMFDSRNVDHGQNILSRLMPAHPPSFMFWN